MKLEGLHHVTCITGDARANLEFYTGVLGLRLVAKSVNQDDPTVYHLFYSDEQGHPGADITFFEYPGVPRGRAGSGMVHTIVWRVADTAALAFWRDRLTSRGVAVTEDVAVLRFADPEGLVHALRVDPSHDAPRIADHPEIPADRALRGFEGVRAYGARIERSGDLLERVLGAARSGEGRWELRGSERGGWIQFDAPPEPRGLAGAGTVHHVAWGSTLDDHPRWLQHLHASGVHSTEIVDRHYFHSIYFREPGGVLYEIADDGPGFTIDSPVEELGRRIILPPRFESHRAEIERKLTPLPDPRANWSRGPAH